MNKSTLKHTITQLDMTFRLFDLSAERGRPAPVYYACHASLAEMMAMMWKNPLNPNSLRLTKAGNDLIIKYRLLEPHRFSNVQIVGKTMLLLEDYMACPYYMNMRDGTFTVYGEEQAIMLALHDNNLTQYLVNISIS